MQCTPLVAKLNLNLRPCLCDYSDAGIPVKGTIAVPNTETAAVPNSRNKKVMFKSCVPFTDCIRETKK